MTDTRVPSGTDRAQAARGETPASLALRALHLFRPAPPARGERWRVRVLETSTLVERDRGEHEGELQLDWVSRDALVVEGVLAPGPGRRLPSRLTAARARLLERLA
jgi:hypothetical protein